MMWVKQDHIWSLDIKGSYRAGNSRCNLLLNDDDSIPTSTTATNGRPTGRLYWDGDEFEPLLSQLFIDCQEKAETVEFFLKHRLVRLQRPATRPVAQRRYW